MDNTQRIIGHPHLQERQIAPSPANGVKLFGYERGYIDQVKLPLNPVMHGDRVKACRGAQRERA